MNFWPQSPSTHLGFLGQGTEKGSRTEKGSKHISVVGARPDALIARSHGPHQRSRRTWLDRDIPWLISSRSRGRSQRFALRGSMAEPRLPLPVYVGRCCAGEVWANCEQPLAGRLRGQAIAPQDAETRIAILIRVDPRHPRFIFSAIAHKPIRPRNLFANQTLPLQCTPDVRYNTGSQGDRFTFI